MNEVQIEETIASVITSGSDSIAQYITYQLEVDPTGTLMFAFGFFLGIFLAIRGVVQTFRRNWVAALLLLVLLLPLYLIWAFVEAFRSKPAPKVYNLNVQNSNV